MNKLLLSFSLITILFSCTSCFEFIEELSLNADGSGHLSVTFNGSKSKGRLNSIMVMDSINGYAVPSKADIEREFYQLKRDLQAMEGISAVSLQLDMKNFIYKVEGDFANVGALNNALNRVVETSIARRNIPFDYQPFDHYSLRGKTFTRTGPSRKRVPAYQRLKYEDRKVFESGEFRSIYRFERPINSVSNPRAKVSANRQAMMFHANVKELMNQRVPMSNTIELQ